MPTTKHGKKVLRKLQGEYGSKKGKSVYFALQVKGKGGKGSKKWEGKGGTGKLAKAKRTYQRSHKNKKSLHKAIKKVFGSR